MYGKGNLSDTEQNMIVTALLAATMVQQQPVPVAGIEVTPDPAVVIAGDTMRLNARALDRDGRPVPEVRFRFVASPSARFEGRVDEDGLVRSGSTGTIPVSVIAIVPGASPVVHRVEVRMVPGPAARVEIEPQIGRLVAGQRVRLSAVPLSAMGDRATDLVRWESATPRVVSVDDDGMLAAVAPGRGRVVARAGMAEAQIAVEVVPNNVARVEVEPVRAHARQGDVMRFRARALDRNGREIAGLAPQWSFAPGHGVITPDGAFVGYEAGDYLVTATIGTTVGQAPVTLTHRGVRRPVEVVGRLPRTLFLTEEVWLHPSGEVAYLGTGGGGDRMYAIDITDPANPFVTDSIVANTRRVNDLMTTPDGRYMVFTREGAADRRNGIVITSLEDPRHPKPIAEFTEGVTAGVHSAFVYRQEPYGTHVYLTNNGTGAIHIIDINDPYNPREVGRWMTDRPDAGRSLHDVDVQDGLAYLSYWNDGLVILDIGKGIKGGSPSNPQFVSQYKYDLNELYRDVEARHGPGFIRGTHTAWRHRNYVFIADEVFPAGDVKGAKDAAAERAFGRLHVLDVTDVERPRPVAWYEPEFGGVHNVWVAGDTLYLGAYNGGFRTFDISGELLGDLRAQAREMVHVHTGDMDGHIPNSPMTWGVVVRDGLAYVNDNHNGLWIIRMLPRREEPLP